MSDSRDVVTRIINVVTSRMDDNRKFVDPEGARAEIEALLAAPSVDDLLTQLHERHGGVRIFMNDEGWFNVFYGRTTSFHGHTHGASLREALVAALKETT